VRIRNAGHRFGSSMIEIGVVDAALMKDNAEVQRIPVPIFIDPNAPK
jgi:hypothetical protein